MLPRVLILYTGGTIGMELSARAVRVTRLSPAGLKRRLLERVPELSRIARCQVEVLFNIDSAHLGAPEWLKMAETIRRQWRDFDGFVVLHGTDTLAYSASALSFLLGRCKKPVVMTGAMRPLSAIRTDARRNLISSVEIAAHGPRPLVNQVTVFFNDRLFQGNRVRKRSASEFSAFESPKAGPLAVVGTEIEYFTSLSKRPKKATPSLKHQFSHRVAMLWVTPGFPSRLITESLLPDLEGLVLVAFPSATGPTHDPDFLDMLKTARDAHCPVVMVTEGDTATPGRGTNPMSYAAGKQIMALGTHWAGEMTPECAFVKASLILGQKDGNRQFGRLWRQNWAAEGFDIK